MRTVLITGATGAIGSVLTRYLVDEPETRVRLLIRARSIAHVNERLQALLGFLDIDLNDDRARRIEAAIGDVTLPHLGLEPGAYDRLAASVTHVIHSAGNVKLNRPLDEARRSALDSARHAMSFVHACIQSGQFVKAEFVSTVGVAGRMTGVVPERPLRETRKFRNTYEAAKAQAEAFLVDQMDAGVPVTIHRPSMVVGTSDTGRISQFQVFYHLCEFLSGTRTAGVIPEPGETRLDIIPADYVARAIQCSSLCPEASGKIFHLCSGPEHAPGIKALALDVQRIFAARGRRVWRLRFASPALLKALTSLATPLAPGSLRKSLKSMPYFMEYLGEPQTFATRQTEAFFTPHGLVIPPVDSYLNTVLSYYLSRQDRPSEGRRIAS